MERGVSAGANRGKANQKSHPLSDVGFHDLTPQLAVFQAAPVFRFLLNESQ